ncbi:hypothetical protein E1298_41375, partial [Actinomadura rubrisoli]
GALVLDVTSRGDEPWVRFSPFYPHGGYPCRSRRGGRRFGGGDQADGAQVRAGGRSPGGAWGRGAAVACGAGAAGRGGAPAGVTATPRWRGCRPRRPRRAGPPRWRRAASSR